MDTLPYTPSIVGPDAGAFKDLSSEGLIRTYKDYDHLFDILPDIISRKDSTAKNLQIFCEENSWNNFGKKVHKKISSL